MEVGGINYIRSDVSRDVNINVNRIEKVSRISKIDKVSKERDLNSLKKDTKKEFKENWQQTAKDSFESKMIESFNKYLNGRDVKFEELLM